MKKIKKILAAVMTLAMVLGMSMTTFAAKDGATITVNGLSTNGNQKVDIYEIYRLDTNDNDWVVSEWAKDTGVTTENLDDETILAALKTEAEGTEVTATTTTATGTCEFTTTKTGEKLQAGAYLILVTDTLNKVTYSTMVAVTYDYDSVTHLIIPKTPTTVTAKAETYSTDKTSEDADKVVQVGDLIEYTITTTVPFTSKDHPITEFWVEDTLTGADFYFAGDELNDGETLTPHFTVKISGQDDPLNLNPVVDGNEFKLDLMSLVNDDNTNSGKTVTITYTVKVNAVDEITNKATSSNDPNTGDGEGEVTTNTGSIQITKYGEDKSETLEGAQFAIYRLKADGTTKEYAKIDENGYVTGEWVESVDDAGTVTTASNGVATVKGLGAGTYYFEEVVAPDGYRVDKTQAEECDCTISDSKLFDSTEMMDTKLASLPETGGIGTTIFTIGGCIIMIAAAGLFFASRRKSSK